MNLNTIDTMLPHARFIIPATVLGPTGGFVMSALRGSSLVEGAFQGLKCSATLISLLSVTGTNFSNQHKMALGAGIAALSYYDQTGIATVLAFGATFVDQYYRQRQTPPIGIEGSIEPSAPPLKESNDNSSSQQLSQSYTDLITAIDKGILSNFGDVLWSKDFTQHELKEALTYALNNKKDLRIIADLNTRLGLTPSHPSFKAPEKNSSKQQSSKGDLELLEAIKRGSLDVDDCLFKQRPEQDLITEQGIQNALSSTNNPDIQDLLLQHLGLLKESNSGANISAPALKAPEKNSPKQQASKGDLALLEAIKRGSLDTQECLFAQRNQKDEITSQGIEIALNSTKNKDIHTLLTSFDDSIKGSAPAPNIYAKTHIDNLKNSYQGRPDTQKKFNLATDNGIREYRNVSGDGNCYYRALMFGFLEQIIEHPQRSIYLNDLAAKINNSSMPEDKKNNLTQCIRSMAETNAISTILDLEALFTPKGQNSFDYDIILAARHLISDHLIKHKDDLLDNQGTTLKNMILISDERARNLNTMEDYCKEYVTKMQEDVDGEIPNTNLLGKILGFNSAIFVIDDTENPANKIETAYKAKTPNRPVNVNLIKSRVHYGLVY